MGTCGTGIFDDDTTCDVRDTFEDAMSEGLDARAATDRVLSDDAFDLEDADDGPLVWLALAALQLEHGGIGFDVRGNALRIIEVGEGLDRWEEASEGLLEERKRVLEELGRQIRGAPAL
jgi:hypothetical protein